MSESIRLSTAVLFKPNTHAEHQKYFALPMLGAVKVTGRSSSDPTTTKRHSTSSVRARPAP